MSKRRGPVVAKIYSQAFKMVVVREIEGGEDSIESVRKKYGIGGCETVQNWLRKFGNGSRGKRIRVETPEEIDELKRLKQRVRLLEESLADSNIELALERQYTKMACQRAGVDVAEFKKKAGGQLPIKP